MGSTDDVVKKALELAKAREEKAGVPKPKPALESLPTLILGELEPQGYGALMVPNVSLGRQRKALY